MDDKKILIVDDDASRLRGFMGRVARLKQADDARAGEVINVIVPGTRRRERMTRGEWEKIKIAFFDEKYANKQGARSAPRPDLKTGDRVTIRFGDYPLPMMVSKVKADGRVTLTGGVGALVPGAPVVIGSQTFIVTRIDADRLGLGVRLQRPNETIAAIQPAPLSTKPLWHKPIMAARHQNDREARRQLRREWKKRERAKIRSGHDS